jgi:hypothetical protein
MKMKTKMRKSRLLSFVLSVLVLSPSFAAAGENKPVNVAGKWQLSWEARLGTERGPMQLDQVDSSLTGSFQGHLGTPRVSGTIKDKSVTLNLEFQGARPFTLVFTGTVDGDKMAGKFVIQGVTDGYDWHGENARPTNYSWTAVRQPDQTQSDGTQQNQPNQRALHQ